MGRPRKWPGETQVERTRAYKRDLYRRQHEGQPDNRPKSKYAGETSEERQRARSAAFYQRHEERIRAWQAEYRKRPEAKEAQRRRSRRHQEKLTPWDRRIKNLRHRYRLTVEQFDSMMSAQDGKCAICREPFGLWCMPAVDHNHETKKVRGILCGFCNRMIGLAKDDIKRLASAIAYIRRVLPDLPPEALHIPRVQSPHSRRPLREQNLRSRYGITPYGYDLLLLAQDGMCAICKTVFGDVHAHVDHDHASNRIRGLLCRACNVLLGMASDDPYRLMMAIAYLKGDEATIRDSIYPPELPTG